MGDLLTECRRAHPGAAVAERDNTVTMTVWHDGWSAALRLVPVGGGKAHATASASFGGEFWSGTVSSPREALMQARCVVDGFGLVAQRDALHKALTPHLNLRVEIGEDGRPLPPTGWEVVEGEPGTVRHAATGVEVCAHDGVLLHAIDAEDGVTRSGITMGVHAALTAIADAKLAGGGR